MYALNSTISLFTGSACIAEYNNESLITADQHQPQVPNTTTDYAKDIVTLSYSSACTTFSLTSINLSSGKWIIYLQQVLFHRQLK